MIDRLVVAYGTRLHPVTNTAYRPTQAVKGRRLFNESGKRLYVVFPHWHEGQGSMYSTLTKRLSRDGSAVVAYELSDDILQPNIDVVLQSFRPIQKQVTEDLMNLKRANAYEEIRLIGISLGNVSLVKVAETFPDFTAATMVVGGSNLARCTWEGIRTQELRRGFEAQGIGENALDAAWQTLAPKNSVGALKGKKVHVFVSTRDRIIPTAYQQEMATTLSEVTDDLKVTTVRAGHAATIFKFCTRGCLI